MAQPTLASEIVGGTRLAFDADFLIYFVEGHDRFSPILRPIFNRIEARAVSGHASFITFLEVLVGPLRSGATSLVDSYRELLIESRGFTLHPLDQRVAEQAASLRAALNLRTPDSGVAATALNANCTHLLTNDSVFRRVSGLNVLVVEDFL